MSHAATVRVGTGQSTFYEKSELFDQSAMCEFSENCCSDFTNYFPAGSICAENVSKVKNKIAWFSKKPRPSTSSAISHHATELRVGEELGRRMSFEAGSSSHVSQEELRALRGCVSKRRAMFSSDQNSLTINSKCGKEGNMPLLPHPLHLAHDRFLSSSDNHLCQNRIEYDRLSSLSQSSIPDSVSVQFRYDSHECMSTLSSGGSHSERIEVLDCCNSTACNFTGSQHLPNVHTTQSKKMNRTDGNQILYDEQHNDSKIMSSPLLRVSHDQSYHNSWPRHRAHPDRLCQYTSAQRNMSPRQLCRQEPANIVPADLLTSNLKTSEPEIVGSKSSVFSVQSHKSYASSSERPRLNYIKGVDGVDFKQKTDKIVSWFKEFNDQQRNMLLLKLVDRSDCAQMHFLSLQMEPILHMGCPHNCQDLLSWLPSYITEEVLGYLDPVSLCRASQVSCRWYQMITTQKKLWMNLCKLNQWQLSSFGESLLIKSHVSQDGTIQWKSVFAEKFRLKRNWLKGYCTVRTFEGHTQGISCIQFDDFRIVSGSWDKTIKVWNRRTNTAWAALTLAGHSGTVRCLHLHSNRLVSGSADRTIKVWDLSTDKVGWVGAACRATMVGHQHTVRCLQADDDKVISGSYDLTLKVWDIITGQCTKTLRGHTDAVLCLQFAEDNVVSGSKDMTIKVWSLSSGVCKLTLHGHQAAVTCVQFDKTKIISGALDTLIKIWNFNDGQCVRTMDWIRSEGHTGVIRHLQADNWKIISAADDKTMKVWSVHTGNRLLTLKSHTDGVTCLQFNDKVIVSGSYDRTVKLWDFSAC